MVLSGHATKQHERRRKQRDANPSRALRMHRARLESPLPATASAPRGKAHVGCSGWFYREWRGGFYPRDMPAGEWFPHYMRAFGTVELNAPFYTWPTAATVRSWRARTEGTDFIYTVKACELITHVRRFSGTKELVRDFGYIADILGPAMGCFLFQLPPDFHYTPARLKAVTDQLDPARRNAVEFRHASWWNEETYRAFRAAGIIFCSCSAPKLPADLVRTADDVYLRFHGPEKWYRHDYTRDELETWAARARESGAKRVWAYFNNTIGGHAAGNAAAFLRLLGEDA